MINQDFSNSQVPFEYIPNADDVTYKKLENSYLIVRIASIVMTALILVAIFYAVSEWLDWITFIPAQFHKYVYIGILAISILSLVSAYFGFAFKGYALRQKDILYRSGWITKEWVHVPFSRAQHSEVSQGVLDRFFGLAKLKVFTAGGSKSDLTIPGLPMQKAHDMKQFILEKIKYDFGEEE